MYVVTTIAGNGKEGHEDGDNNKARFHNPGGITLSKDKKHLFVGEFGNGCIRKVSLVDGTTSTIAGAPGIPFISFYYS